MEFYKIKKEFTENSMAIYEAAGKVTLNEGSRKYFADQNKRRDWSRDIEPYY